MDGYALRAETGEAAMGYVDQAGKTHSLSLLQQPWNGLQLVKTPPDIRGKTVRQSEITLRSGIRVTRTAVDAWEGYRDGIPGEAVYAHHKAFRYYTLPAIGEDGPIYIQAGSFSGRDRDNRLLDRIEPAARASCDTLEPPPAPGTVPDAAIFAPEETAGPAQICGNGLVIDLLPGEKSRRAWGSVLGGYRDWAINGPTGHFRIIGGAQRQRGAGSGSLRTLGFTTESHQTGQLYFKPPQGHNWQSPPFIILNHFRASDEAVDALLDRVSVASPRERACFKH